MHVNIVGAADPQPHPPRQLGHAAEGLAVEEVAPAPDGLSDEKARHAAVGKRPKAELLFSANEPRGQKCRDDCPVDGKPAVPDAVGFRPVDAAVRKAELVKVKEHIVDPRADDGKGDGPKHGVDHVVLGQTVARRALHAEPQGDEQPRGDEHAVPVDAVADVEQLGREGKAPVAE